MERGTAVTSGTSSLPISELMLRFESLGADCQFGSVQRLCGVEPLGLFRFMASSINNLIALLEVELDGFLSPEDLGLTVRSGDYMTFSRRYDDFAAHTAASAATQDPATVAARQSKKAAYLKTRFLADWQAAARIYVYCGLADAASLEALHAALRRRSDCWLLFVTVAERPEDRGRVERLAPGLLRGFLAYHGGVDEWGFRADLPGWALVCRAAEAMVREAPVPPPDEAPAVAARSVWTPTLCGDIACGPGLARCRIRHDCLHAMPAAQLAIPARFGRRTWAVASLWVRLPSSFPGRAVFLTCADVVVLDHHACNTAVRGTWQQVWVVMKMPEDRETLNLSLEVEAPRAAEFEFGGWQVQRGGMPGESLRPDQDAHAPEFDHDTAKPMLTASNPRRSAGRVAAMLRRVADRLDPAASLAVAKSMTEDTIVFDLLSLSNLLMQGKRFDEADAVLAAGKSLYPWRADLCTHHAICAAQRRHLPMAAARWSEVVQGFPRYALAHYRLAATLREMGDIPRAVATIEAALPRHLDDPGMVAEAARVFATAQRWPEALEQWDRAIALAGLTPEWRDARAHAAGMAAAEMASKPAERLEGVPSG